MRLLNVYTQKLENNKKESKYALLSHTWNEDEEVSYQELLAGEGRTKSGWPKILNACEKAKQWHHQYIWIDTCCIIQCRPRRQCRQQRRHFPLNIKTVNFMV
jgi:hypothetical protein